MTYVSIFSGIEAASVAWAPLGWEPLAFAEVMPFPSAVLADHFPAVPNLGDVTEVDWSPFHGRADVVVGGSPCQSFSIAGGRAGLDDERGRLMLEYIRAVGDIRPRWLVWENVAGVLSQSGGGAFSTLLGELSKLGYLCAWRVLDAQFFRVAQRRRRVFVVGSLGTYGAPAVLFEPGCVPGSSGSSRQKRQALARAASDPAGPQGRMARPARPDAASGGLTAEGPHPYLGQIRMGRPDGGGKGVLVTEDMCPTLATTQIHALFQPVAFPWSQGGSFAGESVPAETSPTICAQAYNVPAVALSQYGDVAGTLTARADSSPCSDRGQSVICMADTQAHASIGLPCITVHSAKDPPVVCIGSDSARASVDIDLCGTLHVGGREPRVFVPDPNMGDPTGDGWCVRRLTPREAERLQGFPDDWTALGGKAADAPRYRAIGNSMAVPVMRWIGERIQKVEEVLSE